MNTLKGLAFEEVVAMHGDSVYRICRAYLGDQEEVNDLHQEALINIWKALPSFRGASQPSTWIYRIAVNTAITYRRKLQRDSMRKTSISYPDHIAEDPSDHFEKIRREEQYCQLLEAIEELPPDQRIIIGLFLEDLSYKEIADVIGKDTNYVGVKLKRVKAKLSKKMKP